MNVIRKSLKDGNTQEIVLIPLDHDIQQLNINKDNTFYRPDEKDKIFIVKNENNKRSDESEHIIGTSAEQYKDETSDEKRNKTQAMESKTISFDSFSKEKDFVWDSTSEHDNQRCTRKKSKMSTAGSVGEDAISKEEINERKHSKEARKSGKAYRKKDGSMVREKQLQENPCIGKKCGHNCGNISEEKRKQVFDLYWSLPLELKKDWLLSMSSKTAVKRKRSKNSTYRENTFQYFIKDGDERRQVCMQFMVKTLDISARYIYYIVSNATMGSAKPDQRGNNLSPNKIYELRISAINFIKKLPALPSHYCRKDCTRLYLPVKFGNIKKIYRIYKDEQVAKGVDAVSDRIFREIFTKDFNIGFHLFKKDKCLKCGKFKGKDMTENPEIKKHLDDKEASNNKLTFHREVSEKNTSLLCTFFDLQKVLNTPYGNSMSLCNSRKYTVYNLCFYESVTNDGFCYIWGETEGKKGGNEIATILQKYIKNCDERRTIETLILYADSCPIQNKNKMVLAAIHNALLMAENLETIQVNYVLPGHTEMTSDSIQSTIENSVRDTTVWVPSQWLTICQMARKEPRPYNVEELTHKDFKDIEEFSKKYFEGNLIGKLSKIRVATFKKSIPNIMTVKYSMKEDSPEESISIFGAAKLLNVKYMSPIPINKAKYDDLKKLCDTNVIPKLYHREYLNLPYSNGEDMDTDEDEVEEMN